MPLSMGKVLGGGSSINGLGWARGHKNDWDFFASESGDTAWNYESVLKIYRRIEDWQGAPDPTRCPNSSLSSRPVGMAAQLSFTNVRSLRLLRSER